MSLLLRLLGALLVVAGSTLAGQLLAWSADRKPAMLAELAAGVRLLMSQVDYAARPLPEALADLAGSAPGAAARLFRLVAEALAAAPDQPLEPLWRRAVEGLGAEGGLAAADLAPLLGLAPALGTSHRQDQLRLLDACARDLAAREALRRDEAARSARMWRSLGLFGGILLALVAL
ncbi:MAG: stage III sporulation protein AB [Firmicutes bacterium]|nr:stage III sporulation protein AB [Bacillota bacterium]